MVVVVCPIQGDVAVNKGRGDQSVPTSEQALASSLLSKAVGCSADLAPSFLPPSLLSLDPGGLRYTGCFENLAPHFTDMELKPEQATVSTW